MYSRPMARQEIAASGTGPQLDCDLPLGRSGLVAHNELVLTGWAASHKGIAGVAVQIEDRQWNAGYGLDTPEVAARLPDFPKTDRAGYRLCIDTSDWEPGLHYVTVAAFDLEGDRSAIEGQVEVRPFELPGRTVEDDLAALVEGKIAMRLERPRLFEGVRDEVEGPIEISGWAHANGGIKTVMVTLDGRLQYEALRPIVRPELLAAYGADVAAEAGFTLRLDSTECTPGRHSLSVVAIGTGNDAVGVAGDLLCRPEPVEEPAPTACGTPVAWLSDRKRPKPRSDRSLLRYEPNEHAGMALEAEHRLRYRWALPLVEGKVVLDAGCGIGWGSALLAEAGADKVVGLDWDEKALRQARDGAGDLRLEFLQGNPQALPFDDATFDLVTCFGAIEFCESHAATLDELRRVLRPNGVLMASTPRRTPSLRGDLKAPFECTPEELEQALGARFASVRLHLQRNDLASTIFEDTGAIDDGGADLGLALCQPGKARRGGEDHLIAVASDEEAPDIEPLAMLASGRVIQRLHETALRWEDRALLAEADAAASRREANLAVTRQEASIRALREAEAKLTGLEGAQAELDDTRQALSSQLGEAQRTLGEREEDLLRLKRSFSWRITRPLRWRR
jgi:SAM-dependent methyltransferase